MLNKIINTIEYNIMIILSVFLLLALIIGKVDLITSILIYCMWFLFWFYFISEGI